MKLIKILLIPVCAMFLMLGSVNSADAATVAKSKAPHSLKHSKSVVKSSKASKKHAKAASKKHKRQLKSAA